VHFKLLADVSPLEILAQRIVWSCVLALSLIAAQGCGRTFGARCVP
jgi:EamA domain-containing membrane protein RarD